MPIRIDKKLPAVEILRTENIFVMDDQRAAHQDIRPLKILILNLMPQKMVTETQLLRHLANTPLQLDIDFLYMESHRSKTTRSEHMETFYKTFPEVKDEYFDGMIITGAPVEHLPFEEVDYWEEFSQVIEWSKTHVYSTLHICWGAQAGLYLRYGVEKYQMDSKLSGIYPQDALKEGHLLFRGFDDSYVSPHSRHTEISKEEVLNKTNLEIYRKDLRLGFRFCLVVIYEKFIVLGIWNMTVIPWQMNISEIVMQVWILIFQKITLRMTMSTRHLVFVGLHQQPSFSVTG